MCAGWRQAFRSRAGDVSGSCLLIAWGRPVQAQAFLDAEQAQEASFPGAEVRGRDGDRDDFGLLHGVGLPFVYEGG